MEKKITLTIPFPVKQKKMIAGLGSCFCHGRFLRPDAARFVLPLYTPQTGKPLLLLHYPENAC